MKPGARGLTLIEVLVALALVATALAAAGRAASALTDNAERAGLLVLAQGCAENELSRLRLSRQYPGPGELPLQCTSLGQRFGGRVMISATPNPNFRRVDAEVADAQGRPLLRLTGLLGRY